MNLNYTDVARECTRQDFLRNNRGWFLVGEPRIAAPPSPMATLSTKRPALSTLATQLEPTGDVNIRGGTEPVRVVCAVRKVQTDFRWMITVGRTTNNDIVIVDVTISRFHAYFKETEHGVELVDGGSRNGTRVDGRLLAPRDSVSLFGGERLQFGHVGLSFVDGAGCWDFLRTNR